MLRASAVPRFIKCPASGQEPSLDIISSSEPAELGNGIHEYSKEYVIGGTPNLREIIDKHNIEGEDIYILKSQFHKIWNAMAEHFPEPQTEVKMEDKENDLDGTMDIVSFGHDMICVADLKSGWLNMDYWPQIKTYAWLAINGTKYEKVYCCFFWLRTGEYEGKYFTGQQLQEHVDEINKNREPKMINSYQQGEWCGYCRQLESCPLLKKALTLWEDKMPVVLTPEKIKQYRPVVSMLEAKIKAYKGAEKAFVAKNGAIDMGNGTELTQNLVIKKELNIQKAHRDILEYISADELLSCLKCTNKDLEKIIMSKAERGKMGKAKEDFWEGMKPFIKENSSSRLIVKKKEGV